MSVKRTKLLPSERMYVDYPWQAWAVGWLAVFKGVMWLAYEPVAPDAVLRLLAYKFTLGMLPLVACGIGLWHRRRWACWGLAAVAAANLVFFAVQRQTLPAFMVQSEFPGLSPLLSLIVFLFNGPLGDVLILLSVPALRKHCAAGAGKSVQGRGAR